MLSAFKSFFSTVLDKIEKYGNKLPHPFMIFVYFAIFMILISWLISFFDVSSIHPSTGEEVRVRNLVSVEGLLFMLSSMISNFTEFAPFGLVIVMMLGIGLAQKVGLFETAMKTTILKAPKTIVTVAVIFTGVIGNIASDAATIIIPPLAGMVFYSMGRHPVAGLVAGFAAVSVGFNANFLIAGTDALLAGISTEAAQIVDADFSVTAADNWFFTSASVILTVGLGVLVTEKIVEPRLGEFNSKFAEKSILEQTVEETTKEQINGLRKTIWAALIYIVLILVLVVPTNGILRGEDGSIVPSPFIDNIIPIILLFFITLSVTYGVAAGTIKSTRDVPVYMGEAMKDMAGYIVLIFAVAQFIAYFEWTNLSIILAVNVSELLQNIEFTGVSLFVIFIFIVGLLNMFITSGSAQWALMAPVFVPLFMILGYEPAFTQMAFRIGDSATGVLTPMNPYLIMLLGFMKRYDSRIGFGTLVSIMLPYSIIIILCWTVFFILWSLLGLPIGPGVNMLME